MCKPHKNSLTKAKLHQECGLEYIVFEYINLILYLIAISFISSTIYEQKLTSVCLSILVYISKNILNIKPLYNFSFYGFVCGVFLCLLYVYSIIKSTRYK